MNVHAKLIQDLEESLKLCNYQGTKVLQYIGVYNHHMMSSVGKLLHLCMLQEQLLNYMYRKCLKETVNSETAPHTILHFHYFQECRKKHKDARRKVRAKK